MIRRAFAIALFPLALAACSPNDGAATPPTAQPSAPAAVAVRPATAASAEAPSTEPPARDTGSISGTYAAGTTRLELHGEGTFGLDEAGTITSGSWTLDPDGSIRLDPGSKDSTDRVYRLDAAGMLAPVEGTGPALKRDALP
ncbi:hypothetical protein [Lysobacter xanthus]